MRLIAPTLFLLVFSSNLLPLSAASIENLSPSQPNPHLGVCTHFPGGAWDVDKLIGPMQQLGITVIRNDFYWRDFEREKGKLKMPAKYRDFIDKTQAAGLRIIPILCYGNTLYGTPTDPDGLDDMAPYLHYVRYVVRAMKGKNVEAWQIWNEPNNFQTRAHFGGDESGKDDALYVRKFAELVEATAKVIREEDPTTPIITGVSKPAPSIYMMQRFPQAFANLDGLTDHPYPHRLPPETSNWGGAETLARDGISVADDDHSMTSMFRHLREASKANLGRELPLWITEMGYPTFVNKASHDVFVGFTEEAQAAYLTRFFALAMGAGIRNWCLYTLVDEGDDPTDYPKQQYRFFGILHSKSQNYQPKPAFFALKRATELLGGKFEPLANPPAKLEAKPRSVPFGDAIWSREPKEGFGVVSGPIAQWFRTPEGLVTFIWEAGRYNTETTAVLGRLRFKGQPKFKQLEAYNLQSGAEVALKIVRTGSDLVLDGLPVGSFPIAIRIRD